MKQKIFALMVVVAVAACNKPQADENKSADETASTDERKMFLDVHDLEPGKVTMADVAGAHEKDLAVQGKHNVNFVKYWVDEEAGKVYCLSEASDPEHVRETHKEAHGLMPSSIHLVSDGPEAKAKGKQMYWDIHKLGAGNVTAAAVAEAHDKDLAVQDKYDVNFINYWVDEKEGLVMCLSEAPDSSAVIKVHSEAHGLIPSDIGKVQEGH